MIGDLIWSIITNFIEILVIILKKIIKFSIRFFGNKLIYFNDTCFYIKTICAPQLNATYRKKNSVVSMLNNVRSNPVFLIKKSY